MSAGSIWDSASRPEPAAEALALGADDDGGRRNGPVVNHILIKPLPYRDVTFELIGKGRNHERMSAA
jgi:hypothetical protein